MSGWIKGPGGVFRRRQGLYVRQASAAPVVTKIWRTASADMTHEAAYLADFPGALPYAVLCNAVGFTTWGVNVTFPVDQFNPVFSGVSTCANQITDLSVLFALGYFEAQLPAAGAWSAVGVLNTAPFNFNAFMTGAAPSSWYKSDGTWQDGNGVTGGPLVPLVAGDVLGVVFNTGFGDSLTYYVNGVQVLTRTYGLAGGVFPAFGHT